MSTLTIMGEVVAAGICFLARAKVSVLDGSVTPMTATTVPGISLADIPGLIRRARRLADMSQRDLAQAAGMSAGAVARAEMDGSALSLAALLRILAATGLRLAVLDADGAEVTPMRADSLRDNAGRRYPAHLDVRIPSWPRGLGAGMPRSRPIPSMYCERRQRRDLERDRAGAVPVDHPGDDDRRRMRDERMRAQRAARERLAASRPSAPPLVDCFCGPECESYCQPSCECQCEPRPGRPAKLIRRWPAASTAENAGGLDGAGGGGQAGGAGAGGRTGTPDGVGSVGGVGSAGDAGPAAPQAPNAEAHAADAAVADAAVADAAEPATGDGPTDRPG